ncbi:MAG: DMT family transporter [Terriglobales bacterium]
MTRAPAQHPIRGYVFIAAATLCWGISATLGRAVFTGKLLGGRALEPISPLILAQSRTTLSLLVLGPILLARRGRGLLRISRNDFLVLLLIGIIGIAGSNYFYYYAIQLTNVATAIVLQYTAPVWVLLYMVARKIQRPTVQRIAAVALALLGISLITGIIGGQLRISLKGLIGAEVAAVAFAYYNVGIPPLLQRHDRWKVLVWLLFWAALFWQVVNPQWRWPHLSGGQWIFLWVFAFTSVLVPFSFYITGLQHLDATRAIVTSCLEPVFSIVIAALALGETVSPIQVAGIVVVLGATVLIQMPGRGGRSAVVEPIE